MVIEARRCAHRWERLEADELWYCRLCGLQQVVCPHPSWRRSVLGVGYACGWCGAEPDEARDEALLDDDQ